MGLKRQTYGRQTTRAIDLAAQCFTTSSSPAQQVQDTNFGQNQHQEMAPDLLHANHDFNQRVSPGRKSLVDVFENLTMDEPVENRFTATPKSAKLGRTETPLARQALGVRTTNVETGSPKSVRSSKRNALKSKIHAEASPAAIAADLRSALWSQPQSDKASGVNVSPDGTITSVYGSPAQNTRSSASRRQQSLLRHSPQGSPTPALSPSTRLWRNRGRDESPTSTWHAEPSDPYAVHTAPLLNLCGDPQGRNAPQPFQPWADSLDEHLDIIKIAEASYGEVYRLSPKDVQISIYKAEDSVVKIIALKPPPDLTSRRTKAQEKRVDGMSAVEDVAGETQLLQRMSDIPGFANFRECRVFQGQLPPQLVRAWRDFNRNVKKSEFPDPGRRGSYEDSQLWAVLEMEDAGEDVEGLCESHALDEEDGESVEEEINDNRTDVLCHLRSVWGIWDVFWGVALAVAKGEEWAGFEHRDLHPGNVCVKSLSQHGRLPDKEKMDTNRTFGFTGLETTLIDYTISRADMVSHSRSTAFYDLSKDSAIFEGNGEDDYQYDIYRYMRAAVLHGDPMAPARPGTRQRGRRGRPPAVAQDSKSPWKEHHPLTNLVWLHFLLYKLTEQLVEWPSSCTSPAYAPGREKARRVGEKALELENRLHELTGLLDLHEMKNRKETMGLESAKDLVGWAVEEGWLSEAEALGIPPKGLTDGTHDGALVDDLTERLDQQLDISNEGRRGEGRRGRSHRVVR